MVLARFSAGATNRPLDPGDRFTFDSWVATDPRPVIDGIELRRVHDNRVVLDGATLTIHGGERVGLVGDNGSGKSTLARILAGIETPSSGTLSVRRGAKVDYLAQDPFLDPDSTIGQVVLSSLEDWTRARSRHEEATAALGRGDGDTSVWVARQAAAGDELERLGGWERMHEAEAILGHLGIRDPDRPVGRLSGGERRRVALARLLVQGSDLAILDEPTNHLDVETIEWLEDYLSNRFEGALLLITHDRYVLDRVATRTLELHRGRITGYAGGYARYLEGKAERLALEERTERNRRNFLRTELEWLRRQPQARTTKQKARVQRATEALEARRPEREKIATVQSGATRLGKTVLTLENLSVERDGRTLVRGLDLQMGAGDRIGIVGRSGSGKTSLLLALLGRLPVSEGRILQGQNTQPAYLDQLRADLDDADTVRAAVASEQSEVVIGEERLDVGFYLERFLFDRRAQRMEVGDLSGGERARVCLARLLCRRANLLILDEPTNDLDVSTLGALEAMLVDYAGCVLVVSHDRWFLDRVATRILALGEGGQVEVHEGNYSEFRARQVSRPVPGRGDAPPADRPARREKPAQRVRLSFSERRELEGLLDAVADAEERVRSLEGELADPETYRQRGEEVAGLQADLAAAHEEVTRLLSRWEELEEKNPES